jgi:hypothetical protein
MSVHEFKKKEVPRGPRGRILIELQQVWVRELETGDGEVDALRFTVSDWEYDENGRRRITLQPFDGSDELEYSEDHFRRYFYEESEYRNLINEEREETMGPSEIKAWREIGEPVSVPRKMA